MQPNHKKYERFFEEGDIEKGILLIRHPIYYPITTLDHIERVLKTRNITSVKISGSGQKMESFRLLFEILRNYNITTLSIKDGWLRQGSFLELLWLAFSLNLKDLSLSNYKILQEEKVIKEYSFLPSHTITRLDLSCCYIRKGSRIEEGSHIEEGIRIKDEDSQFIADVIGSCKFLESVNLSRNELTFSNAQCIIEVFASLKNLKHVDLSHNKINMEGCKVLNKYLENNDVLLSFNISYNLLGCEAFLCLFSAIKTCKNLENLNISRNSIYYDGYKEVFSYLENNRTLSHFSSSLNATGFCDNLDSFIQILNTNHVLTYINISRNSIPKKEIIKIFTELTEFSTIRELVMDGNEFSLETVKFIEGFFERNKNIRSISADGKYSNKRVVKFIQSLNKKL